MSKLSSLAKFLVAGVLLAATTMASADSRFMRWTNEEYLRANDGYMLLPPPVQVPAGRTMENMKASVEDALRMHGWTGKEIAPGLVEATYNRANKHELKVNVKYDTSK